jgi:gamma-glutamyltranspeptidase
LKAGFRYVMGGKVQAQIHVQVLLQLLAGAGAQDAVGAPRFAVGPMEAGEPATTVRVEEDCGPAVPAALLAAGMRPVTVPRHSEWMGHAQVIWLGGAPAAGSDPRADGTAVVLGS